MVRRRDSASSVLGTLEALLSIEGRRTTQPATTAADLIARSVGLNKSVLDEKTPTTIKEILEGGMDEDQQPYECAKRILNRFVTKFSKTVGDLCALVAAEGGFLIEPMVNFPECKQPLDVTAAVAELVLLKPFLDDLVNCDQTWLTAEAVESLSDARFFFGVAKLVLKDQLPFQAEMPPDNEDDSKTSDETSTTSKGKDSDKRLRRVDETDAFIVENLQSGHREAVKRILDNLSADTFKMHELEALYKHSFLVDDFDHARIMLETIPEVENMMDIRVHEIFFKLLRKCLSQLSTAHRDKAIALAFEKRGMPKLKKLGEAEVKELKDQWTSTIQSPERFADTSTAQLTELITWALIVDASTYLVDLLMAFMNEGMRPHLGSVVRVLRDMRSIANVQTGGRPLLHCALDRVAKQWSWLWSQQKQKPPPLDRFGWLVQGLCRRSRLEENEPGILSAGSIFNALLLPAAVEGNNSGYSSGLVAAAIAQLLASDHTDIDFTLSSRVADVWEAADAVPTSVDPNTVEAPKIIHLVMQWYTEPATDDVQERRRCSLLGRLFTSLDNRLKDREWPSSTVDWLKSKLSKHSWRVRHFLIKHLMAQSLGKQWPDELPEQLRLFLDDPQAQKPEEGVVALKELLSLMSVTTEPIAVDVIERLIEALPSKTPKQTVLMALSTALTTLSASHRSSEQLSRLLSVLFEKVVQAPAALAHDYVNAIHLIDTVDSVVAESLNAAEARDKAWLSLLDWFIERIGHLAAAIDEDVSLPDEMRKARYAILVLNVAPIKFLSAETTPASMIKLNERLAKGAGREPTPPKSPVTTVAAPETELPVLLTTSRESNTVMTSHDDVSDKSGRKKKSKSAEKKSNRAGQKRGSESEGSQRSAMNGHRSKQTEEHKDEMVVVESVANGQPPRINTEPSATDEEQHQQRQQGRQHSTSFNCDEEGHLLKDSFQPPHENTRRNRSCFTCGEEGHVKRDCPKPLGDETKQADRSRNADALIYNPPHRPERTAQNVVDAPVPSDNPITMFDSAFAEGQTIAVSDGGSSPSLSQQNNRNDIQEGRVSYSGGNFEGDFSQRKRIVPANGRSDRPHPNNCFTCKLPGHKASQCPMSQRDFRSQDNHNFSNNRQSYGTAPKFNNDLPPTPCDCGEWHWKRECPNPVQDRQYARNRQGSRQDSTAPQYNVFGGARGNYNSAGGGSHRGGQHSSVSNDARGGVTFGSNVTGGGGNYVPHSSASNFNNGGNYRQQWFNGPSQASVFQPGPSAIVTSHRPPIQVNLSTAPPPVAHQYTNRSYRTSD